MRTSFLKALQAPDGVHNGTLLASASGCSACLRILHCRCLQYMACQVHIGMSDLCVQALRSEMLQLKACLDAMEQRLDYVEQRYGGGGGGGGKGGQPSRAKLMGLF